MLFDIPVKVASEAVTLFIAAYGAVLSTYLFFYRVRPKLKVTMNTAIASYPPFEGRLYVKAVNVRNTAVTFDAPYILLSKKAPSL
jgi:hypothetical protein